MSQSREKQVPSAAELTIVPCPQRSSWAVVNRRGDTVATGSYDECIGHMARLIGVVITSAAGSAA
jgi:hypothetical protein